MNYQSQDLYSLYEREALGFNQPTQSAASLLRLLLQASGIFVCITLIVFCVANYQFIRTQIAERQGRPEENLYLQDTNENSLPDWWERQYQLNLNGEDISQADNDNDQANNLLEYQYGTNPINPDTDQDGQLDGVEISQGYNPNGTGRLDSDKDEMYDWWEKQNGLDPHDSTDANRDEDKDGLTNLQEAKFLTDPRTADTDKDGSSDAQEIQLGTNPLGSGLLKSDPLAATINDADQDGLEDFWENIFGTNLQSKDSDSDGYDDFKELTRGYDPTGEGMLQAQLIVPSINVDTPIIWSQSEDVKSIEKDLENGAIHYPGTAFPGRQGNVYVTAHSSYYDWSSSPYKEVLKNLDQVKENEKIIIQLTPRNGKSVNIIYLIRSTQVVPADDPQLLRDYEGHELTLVTCWPVGTNYQRMMVKADLESPQLQ